MRPQSRRTSANICHLALCLPLGDVFSFGVFGVVAKAIWDYRGLLRKGTSDILMPSCIEAMGAVSVCQCVRVCVWCDVLCP